MTVITKPFNRLTLAGKIILPLAFLLVVLTIVLLVGWVSGILGNVLQDVLDTLGANIDIVRFLVAATAVLLITVPTAFLIIFMELKIIAFVNLRVGSQPDRSVGHPRVDGRGLQGARQGGLHAHRRRRAGLHPGASGGLPGQRDDAAGDALRARASSAST